MYKRTEYLKLKPRINRSISLRKCYDWTINLDRGWKIYDCIIIKFNLNNNLKLRLLNRIKRLELYLPNILSKDTKRLDRTIFSNIKLKINLQNKEEHTVIMAKNHLFKKSGSVYRRGLFMFDKDIEHLRYLLTLFLRKKVCKFYNYIHVPTMVSTDMLTCTGQLPKFKDLLFSVDQDWYLSPTGEVQLGNLPIMNPNNYTTLSHCFRNEVNYGKKGKGLIRNLEFEKMELFCYSEPWKARMNLRKMMLLVSNILLELGIPYRILRLGAQEISWSAKRTYDFETWLPISKHYLELSSVSNCGDYQMRRRGLRFKSKIKGSYYPYTLNGSCLPTGRTLIALTEYYGLKGALERLQALLKR